jgi:hypothetical protein
MDEFAVRLQVHIRTHTDCALVLSRINDLILENLIGAILAWEDSGTRVPMLHYDGERLLVLGGLDYQLTKTFALFSKKREVTARDIVELENVALNHASNRLKRLYDYRLVLRSSKPNAQGSPFVYSLPIMR